MYDLVKFWGDGVPNGGTVRGTGKSVAALVEHYRGMGSTSADGLQAVEELVGWIPERGGVANIGLNRAVPFPTTVTHYVSTGPCGSAPSRSRTPSTAVSTAGSTRHAGPIGGGTTTHDTWFGGPIGSRVSPLTSVTNGSPPPTREDNELFLSMGAFTDAAGHLANSDIFSAEYNGKIYVDDVLEHDIFASVFMNAAIPAGDHRIRVVTDIQRKNLFWQLSTGIKTEWTFESDQPHGFLAGAADARHRLRDVAVLDQQCPRGPVRLHGQVLDAGHGGDATDRQAQRRHLVGRRPDLAAGEADQVRRHLLQGRGAQPGRRAGQPARLGHRCRGSHGDPAGHRRLRREAVGTPSPHREPERGFRWAGRRHLRGAVCDPAGRDFGRT